MQYKKDIEKTLKEMETRKSSYLFDMVSYKEPNGVVYDTELIRKLEVTDGLFMRAVMEIHLTIR